MSLSVSASDNQSSDTASWSGRAGASRLSELRSWGRRSVPHAVLGVFLLLVCIAAFVVIAVLTDDRTPALVLARPVSAGQVLSDGDLREVSVATDNAGVRTIPASQKSSVLGRTVAFRLPAGTLLTPDAIGSAQIPEPGRAIVALALKPGQAPPDLAAGAHVLVVQVPAADQASPAQDADAAWRAVVIDVQPQRSGELATVVSIQVAQNDAREIAALPDQVRLLEVRGS